MTSELALAVLRSMDRGSLSSITATTGSFGLISGDISWHEPRTHWPLWYSLSGNGGAGRKSGVENHCPGAIAIGRSASSRRARIIPTTVRSPE